MKQITRKNEKGFTLVELAIVMIIIGLLIGGVLKGQELIENAKVTATISQVKGFQAALNTFRDTYGAVPGDMRNAMNRLQGCTAAPCGNGSGDSLISMGAVVSTTEATAGTAGTATQNAAEWDLTSNANNDESFMVWKHLALANLITGVDPTTATVAWGQSHPTSSLRGGYQLYYDTTLVDVGAHNAGTTGGSNGSGHVLRLSNGGVTGAFDVAGGAPASALQAANIDRKLDDGRPNTGSVLAAGGTAASPCVGGTNSTDDSPAYNEQIDQKNCVIYFLIDG